MAQAVWEPASPADPQTPDVYHLDQVGEFTYGPIDYDKRDHINGHRKYYKHCRTCMYQLDTFHATGKEPDAPKHEFSNFCQSGKYPHCTCDRCF